MQSPWMRAAILASGSTRRRPAFAMLESICPAQDRAAGTSPDGA